MSDYDSRPVKGLGDVVARITQMAGVKPCGNCQERRARWNEKTPEALKSLFSRLSTASGNALALGAPAFLEINGLIVSGEIPPGLVFDGMFLRGEPTQAGIFHLTVSRDGHSQRITIECR